MVRQFEQLSVRKTDRFLKNTYGIIEFISNKIQYRFPKLPKYLRHDRVEMNISDVSTRVNLLKNFIELDSGVNSITDSSHKYKIDNSVLYIGNGNKGEWREVICGIPQGCTLEPLLFLVYVNSILELPLKGPVFPFADDTAIVYSGVNFEVSRKKCGTDLKILSHWFIFYKISPNLKKTKFIQYFYKRTKNVQHSIIWPLPSCLTTNSNCTKIELRKFNYLLYTYKIQYQWK